MKKILFILISLLLFNVINTVECYSQRKSFALDVNESGDYYEATTINEDLNISLDATINIHGGTYADDIKCYGTSKLKIKPGEAVITDGIGLYSDGKTSTIEDGWIGGMVFVGNEEVSHTLEVSGGQFQKMWWTYNESLIKVTGHDFNYDIGNIRQIIEDFDPESGTTTYTEINREGTLTGTLENGDSLDVNFRMLGNSNIELISDE